MNGLSELNTYSNTGFEFTDDRPPSYTFDPVTPVNQSITVNESQPFVATPGTNITSIISREADLTFNVNVATLPGASVSWDGLSAHLTQSNAAGVYSLTGIRSAADWDTIVDATLVTMPANSSNWTFTSNIEYTSGNVSWVTAVTVRQLEQLTAASDYYYPTGASNLVTGYPQVFALDFDVANTTPASYTCTVSSNDNSVFGNLSANGSSWSSNVLTLTGNLSTINTKLGNITYWPKDGIETTWLATYSLYNSAVDFTSNITQYIKSQDAAYLSAPTSFYYDRNVPSQTLTGQPTIVDVISNTAANYTMAISSVESGAFGNLVTTFGTGTSVFSANVLTITGNKATVNSHLATLTYSPATDWDTDFHLRYQLTVPGGNVSVRLQDGLVSANNTIISNMTTSRGFVSNTQDQLLFPTSIPQIVETVDGATYTIYLSSTAGKFNAVAGGAGATSNYSYTGTKAQVNALFSTILFYPNKDVIGSQTFTYEQLRNGVSQTSQTVALIGTARTLPYSGVGQTVVSTTQEITLTYEQSNYLFADIFLVGGGGSGEWCALGGGGGSGGNVLLQTNVTVTSPITVTVGAGALTPASWPGLSAFNTPTYGGNTSVSFSSTVISVEGGMTGYGHNGGNVSIKTGGVKANASYAPPTWPTTGTLINGAAGGGASISNNGTNASATLNTQTGDGAAGYLYLGTYFGGGGTGGRYPPVLTSAQKLSSSNGGHTITYSGVPTGAGGYGSDGKYILGPPATPDPYNGTAGQNGLVIITFHT